MPDTRLRALMFNAVAPALGGFFLPLRQRQAVADALLAVVETELQQLRTGIPLVCSDERHQAKVAALEAELDRLRQVEAEHAELTREQAHPLISCGHGVRTVSVAALARKISEKRTALHQRAEACAEVDRLRIVLAEVLRTFVHKTHPGRPCLQSQHVDVTTVQRWRDALHPHTGGSDGS
jgi:hypothetical protein